MTITIKQTEVELKNKMRSLLIYEQIANKPFNPTTITDMMLYFYSTILACSPNIELTFTEFMDIVDDEPNLFTSFQQWLTKESEKNNVFEDDSKKKRRNSKC